VSRCPSQSTTVVEGKPRTRKMDKKKGVVTRSMRHKLPRGEIEWLAWGGGRGRGKKKSLTPSPRVIKSGSPQEAEGMRGNGPRFVRKKRAALQHANREG